jgi:methionyl-tRNA formyltransferase
VFFGTPQFAVPTLEALLASRHPVVAVVTQPDRPRGRGQRTSDAPVKARALDAAVPVLQPASLKDPDLVPTLARLHADLGVVAAYGKILTEAVLATPRLGMINVHASLLPKYRGAAPVHRAVIAGEHETGVTIMRVVKALDAGPMLATVTRGIGQDETSADVERDLSQLGARLLVETLDRLAAGPVVEVPQDDREATYASRLTKEDGIIDWSQPAVSIHNLVRGLHPWPHAFTFLGSHRLIIRRSSCSVNGNGVERPSDEVDLAGTIVHAQGDRLDVATGHGLLRVLEIQAEGGRPLPVREFLAGHRLAAGDRFSSRP